MRVDNWLKQAGHDLGKSGVGTAQLDCLVLLEDTTGKDRTWLLAHPEFELATQQLKVLEKQIKSRRKHTPLAYIRGKTEFYGREFIVNKYVLEPRPESEAIIELLKSVDDQKPVIADIGTGSGALAITAKLELPKSEVIATDIDSKCLAVARKNATAYSAGIEFIKGDLLQPISNRNIDILVCNLPYVPDKWQVNRAATAEPRIAIFGGADGLDLYRKLFTQIDDATYKPTYVLTESLPPQHKKLAAVAKKHGYKLANTSDFIQLFTILEDSILSLPPPGNG